MRTLGFLYGMESLLTKVSVLGGWSITYQCSRHHRTIGLVLISSALHPSPRWFPPQYRHRPVPPRRVFLVKGTTYVNVAENAPMISTNFNRALFRTCLINTAIILSAMITSFHLSRDSQAKNCEIISQWKYILFYFIFCYWDCVYCTFLIIYRWHFNHLQIVNQIQMLFIL